MSKVEPISYADDGQEILATTRSVSIGIKLLIVTAVALLIVCISLAVVLIVRAAAGAKNVTQTSLLSSTTSSSSASSPNDVVCQSKVCLEAAYRIQQSMDTTENPCENFYRFACNGWEKRNIISEDSSSSSIFDKVNDDMLIAIKNVLELPVSQQDTSTTQLSKYLYSSCMNVSHNEQRGLQTLRNIAVAVGGLPIITTNYNANNKDFQDIYSYTAVYGSLLKNPFLFSYEIDAKNSTRYLFQYDQPSNFGILSSKKLNENDEQYVVMNAYKNLLKNYLRLLQEDFNTTLRNVTSIVNRVVQFETNVSQATVPTGLRRDVSDYYNITTLENLSLMFPLFNWRDFIYRVYQKAGVEITLTENYTINLGSYTFFQRVAHDTLFTTDAKETMSYVHLFNAINGIIRHLPKKYRNAYSDFSEIVLNTAAEKPLFKVCHDVVNEFLGHAIGRIFVDSNFEEASRTEILSTIQMLVQAFESLIKENLWLDRENKEKILQKLHQIQYRIGYPDWIKHDEQLAEHYKDLELKNKDAYFIQHLLIISKWSSAQFFRRFNKPVDKNEWITTAAVLNAMYYSAFNTINFPAGILQIPFFHKEYPRYLNFGAIGFIIGHELTHGFDDEGRQFDGHGNNREWWTAHDVTEFNTRAQCFINQYSNFTTPNGIELNGIQTQGENIADNGGIRQAFKAYREWVRQNGKEEARLLGLNFTPNQLLFLNFASIWCHKEKRSNWQAMILSDVHSPGMFRVLGSLQNLAEFQTAFNCPKNSNMNKHEKCVLW